jgi:hypothetical protein
MQTLKAMADELSKHELPAIEGRTGLPLLSTRTFVGHLLVVRTTPLLGIRVLRTIAASGN